MPNSERGRVAYGYIPGFKGENVFLFVGNAKSLGRFARYLEKLQDAGMNVPRILDAEAFFVPKSGTRLTLTLTDRPTGMRRIITPPADSRFEWTISKDLAGRFAQLIKAVAVSEPPSHQYLDAGTDAVTVMVSKGEYEEIWLQNR